MYFNTLTVASKIAKALGKTDDAATYKQMAKALQNAVKREYLTLSGRISVGTVAAYALSLHFNIFPSFKEIIAKELNEKVKGYNYKTVTGFIGTPFLLFALADNGYAETAGKVLLNCGCPGWLYQVDMGATTVWERWNTILSNGKPNPNGMNSCNHYAYGAVMEYIYRRICGLEPYIAGFKGVRYAPMPCAGIPEINCSYDSASGKISCGYKQENGKIRFYISLPKGVRAKVCLPNEKIFSVCGGSYSFEREWENLDVVPFDARETLLSEFFANPKAEAAFIAQFSPIMHEKEIAFIKACDYKTDFLMTYLVAKGRLTERQFDEKIKALNEQFLGK